MAVMSREEIQDVIPHRDPFLWLDEVIEMSEGIIYARKVVSAELEVFQGHYPNFPVLPGVLQLEAIFQAGAVLIGKSIEMESGQVPVVTRVNNVQFRKMVRPRDVLDLEVQLEEQIANAFMLKGKASVAGKVTARVEFVCAGAEVSP